MFLCCTIYQFHQYETPCRLTEIFSVLHSLIITSRCELSYSLLSSLPLLLSSHLFISSTHLFTSDFISILWVTQSLAASQIVYMCVWVWFISSYMGDKRILGSTLQRWSDRIREKQREMAIESNVTEKWPQQLLVADRQCVWLCAFLSVCVGGWVQTGHRRMLLLRFDEKRQLALTVCVCVCLWVCRR